MLKTRSHGNVEAGFYASFMDFFRFGKYAFKTQDLCELATFLAENPKTKKLRISASDSETMFRGKKSLEEQFNFLDEKTIIPVKLSWNRKSILIGKYELKNPDFKDLMQYLVDGGIYGWENGKNPDFALKTDFAIRQSKNILYKDIIK